MELNQKCNKIYLYCSYGVVLWELNNIYSDYNEDLDKQDVKKDIYLQ